MPDASLPPHRASSAPPGQRSGPAISESECRASSFTQASSGSGRTSASRELLVMTLSVDPRTVGQPGTA
jgi:hypothetical protein